MQCNQQHRVTHSTELTPGELYVSIGYISLFIGLSNMRLHTVLKNAEHIYHGKRKLYPLGKTILYLIENNSFKYSKNLTVNGKKMKQLQGVINNELRKNSK